MTSEEKNPTMKDVANEAGVALGTVSKVVRGIPVGEEYRVKVERAIKKLNYRVNNYARGLRTSRTGMVAVLLPNLAHPYFAALGNALNHSLSQKGLNMMVCCTDGNPDAEQYALDLVDQNKADGVIALTYDPDLKIHNPYTFIAIDRVLGQGIPTVASDNYGGGQLAVRELIHHGCTSLAYIGSVSSLANEPAKRYSGFENACRFMNIPFDSIVVQDGPDGFYTDFLKQHIHDGKLDFDGIFCCTDLIVRQVMDTLKDMHISVPEDVQMIGFDGVREFGIGNLKCSTIIQPVQAIADTAAALLTNAFGEGITPPLICLPVEFAEGGTTRKLL